MFLSLEHTALHRVYTCFAYYGQLTNPSGARVPPNREDLRVNNRRAHRRMSSEEQARMSQMRYGQEGAARELPRARPAARSRRATSEVPDTISRDSVAARPRAVAAPRRRIATVAPTPELGDRPATTRAEGAATYAARRRRGRGHKVLRGVLITLVVLLVGAGSAFAFYLMDINGRLSNGVTDALRNQLVAVEAQDPFYMLLLGVDKSDDRASEWGSSTANFRSDTIILARVDPKAKTIALVSIPRDTLVDMDEHGKQKINAAYSYGGAAYMVKVVSRFAGVNVSHYAEIDFDQFVGVVDTIGGIDVDLPVPVVDMVHADVDLPAGEQTINGEQALGLVRARHAYDAYGGGDFYRAANQRMVIGAILRKVLKQDPATMAGTISTLADSVTTDFSVTDIMSLASQFRGFDIDTSMFSGQTPTESKYVNGGWYEIPKDAEWKTMMDRVGRGESPYSDASQDFTAGVAGSVGTITGSDKNDSNGKSAGH